MNLINFILLLYKMTICDNLLFVFTSDTEFKKKRIFDSLILKPYVLICLLYIINWVINTTHYM